MEENSTGQAGADNKVKLKSKRKKRKPSLTNQLKSMRNKLGRISAIADGAVATLDDMQINVTGIEDLKKKLKEM